MPIRTSEAMSQARRKETVTAPVVVPLESAESRPGRKRTRCASISPQSAEDLIPYTTKELKYLWTMWDEAERQHRPGLRYRNIYGGAVGVILTGWLISGLGLSYSAPFGGILMLSGTLIGAWYCLKSLRQQKHSASRG
jgi:hypothetical protein